MSYERTSRAVFGLNNRKSGVNMHLRFYPFKKNSEMCRVWMNIIHLTMAPTRHISDFFFEMDKTTGAYSLQIYHHLSQIQL